MNKIQKKTFWVLTIQNFIVLVLGGFYLLNFLIQKIPVSESVRNFIVLIIGFAAVTQFTWMAFKKLGRAS